MPCDSLAVVTARDTQDGDCEGSIILDRLPSKAEAAEIRDILGIPQARHLSDERRAIMSEIGAANLKRFKAQRHFKSLLPASAPEPATMAPEHEMEHS